MVNMEGATRANVWMSCECDVRRKDADTLGARRFVRTGNVSGDIKTYDPCAIVFGMFNCSAPTGLGEFHIDYDIEFYTPSPASAEDGGVVYANIESVAGTSRTLPFGTSWTVNSTLPIPDDVLVQTGQRLRLPEGKWGMVLYSEGTSTAADAKLTLTRSSTVLLSFLNFSTNQTAGAQQMLSMWHITVTSSNPALNTLDLIYNTPATSAISYSYMDIFPVADIASKVLKGIHRLIPQPRETRLSRLLKPLSVVDDKTELPSAVLVRCLFCEDPEPDHIGRNCPKNPRSGVLSLPTISPLDLPTASSSQLSMQRLPLRPPRGA